MARGPSNSPNRRSPAKKKPAKAKRPAATAPAKGTRKKTAVRKSAKAARGAKGAGRKASKAMKAPKAARKATAKRAKKSAAPRTPPAQTQGTEEKGGDDAPAALGSRVEVRNVNVPGYRTTVDARKYHAMKETLFSVLPRGEPGLTQSEMFDAVRGRLPEDVFPGQDKAEWWVKCVQLDQEARGAMKRSASKPLRWRLA